jgi:chemotaxis-related protein WspD
MMTSPAPITESPCWKTIGIFGDRSCDKLDRHVHCRNCPTYRLAGRQLLDRPMPPAYRAEVSRQLAAPPREHQADNLRFVVFRVANVWLALPSGCFEESLSPVPVVPVPLKSNRHFLGLVNTHGDLQLCFTLEHYLSPDPEETVAASGHGRVFPRLLVVRLQGQRWVFTADEVLGTVDQPRGGLQALPANLAKSSQRLVSALFDREGLRIKIIDEERLATLLGEALS